MFPSQKYRFIHDRLLRDRFATEEDFVRPEPAPDADILAVHEPGWVDRLRPGRSSYHEMMQLEIPYSRELVEAFWLAAGGSTLAARLALEQGIGFNIGGGFHHAFAGTRRRVLRHQRYRGGHPPHAARWAHPARHGGGLRCASRQRHRRDFRRRRFGFHACPFTSTTIIPRKSRRPAWISTCRTASATKSTCTGWATAIARR